MHPTRWLAYDDPIAAASAECSNAEIEPGNRRAASVGWSAADLRPCAWSGLDGAGLALPKGPFASSVLPHRTLTIELTGATAAAGPVHSTRAVAFVPAAFVCFPPAHSSEAEAAEESSIRSACAAHRECALHSLLSSFESSSSALVAGSAHTRFRWLWLLCRDAADLQQSAAVVRRLSRHPNLSAPVETHNPKALHRNMSALVMPRPTAAAAETDTQATVTHASETVASPGSSPSPPPSAAVPSAYAAYLSSCGVGLLPETPLRCSLSDPAAMSLELLRALVHAQTCRELNWPMDGAKWITDVPADAAAGHWSARWRVGFDAACASVQAWLQRHIAHRAEFARFVLHRFAELMHPRAVVQLLSQALPLDWTDATFQAAIVRLLLHSNHPAKDYPCSVDHAFAFWSALLAELEWARTPEIDDGLPEQIGRLLAQRKAAAARPQQTIDAHYWTATYRHECIAESEEDDREGSAEPASASASAPLLPFDFRSVTLRLSSGFGSTTGLTLWPAGFLLCEWILQYPQLFRAVLLHRAGASTLVCTDGDEQVVLNLQANFRINGLPEITPIHHAAAAAAAGTDTAEETTLGPGVFVSQLLWGSDDSGELIRRAAPDVIVSCDTIYLPEFHEALARTLREALTQDGTTRRTAASAASAPSASSSSPRPPPPARVAYFAQVNRNPATFASYLSTFAKHGLKMEPMRYRGGAGDGADAVADTDDATFLPCRFAYDRECLQMHRITLEEEGADSVNQSTAES